MPKMEDRIALFDWWKAELIRRQQPFVVIDGNDWQTRFQKAVVAVYQNIPEMITARASKS
jgi:nicotinamide riboside kinase